MAVVVADVGGSGTMGLGRKGCHWLEESSIGLVLVVEIGARVDKLVTV